MPDFEKQAYQRFVENRRIEIGVLETARYEGQEIGEQIGQKRKALQAAKVLKENRVAIEIIIASTGLTQAEIEAL